MKAKVGYRIDIPCSAEGVPPPTITWLKDRNPLLIDSGQYAVSTDGMLSISNVLLSDSGTYKCVANNIAGQDEVEIIVHVQGNYNIASRSASKMHDIPYTVLVG